MIKSSPKVLEQAGIAFSVQTIETTDEYLLIRIRKEEMIPNGFFMREKLSLIDGLGTEVKISQSSGAGVGPFAGIVDLAFPADPELDLSSPLTLVSENTRMTFQF